MGYQHWVRKGISLVYGGPGTTIVALTTAGANVPIDHVPVCTKER